MPWIGISEEVLEKDPLRLGKGPILEKDPLQDKKRDPFRLWDLEWDPLGLDKERACSIAEARAAIEKGLGRKESTPAAKALFSHKGEQFADEHMIGKRFLINGHCSLSHDLYFSVLSIPSITGICKSIIQRSRSSYISFSFVRPSRPFLAVTTVWPEPFMMMITFN
jgi:hypothetical protein